MPLTAKGEKIKSAMEEHYGKEKGEAVFYASENKGNITGITKGDRMPCSPEAMKKAHKVLDSMLVRFDAIFKRRYPDAFEEARHPRNAGGVFTTGEGEEAKEDDDNEFDDTQDDPGNLGKKNAS